MEVKAEIPNKTLLSTHDDLVVRLSQLNEISELSKRLVERLQRTDPSPINKEEILSTNKTLNIVDLFGQVAIEMETNMSTIGKNIEVALKMIG